MRRAARGFTLIELITVIVILSIIAVIGSQFIVSATESYDTTQNRARLVNTGRQALERMARQVRTALPYSARVTNSGNCLEFVSIVDSGVYSEPVSTESSSTSLPVESAPDSAGWLSIAPLSEQEIYGSAPASRTQVVNIDSNTVTHTARQWPRNSEGMRFFMVNRPAAFCLVGDQLRYYEQIDWSATSVPAGAHISIIADNVQAKDGVDPFSVGLDTTTNRSLANFSLIFSHGGESVAMSREVAIRNVP